LVYSWGPSSAEDFATGRRKRNMVWVLP
jgi:hypothetical protein